MKTTILLFVLIFGCIIPTYPQINLHHKTDAGTEQFLGKKNKKNDDFGNYKFVDKFSDAGSDRASDNFNMSPMSVVAKRSIARRPAPTKFTKEIYSGDDMPCFHPKGNYIPCLHPKGSFYMRLYKPESVIWGTLWSDSDSIVH